MSAIALDPLIAEAKRRAHRRYLIMLAALVVVAAAAFGVTDPHLAWPANGVLVAVGNWPPDSTVSGARPLRVTRSSFAGMEGSSLPTAHFGVRSHGRILDTYVTVATLTPATIAAANQALAGVWTCSV